MLCEVCKKNDANVHITKIVNGTKHEFSLCEKCAKEKGEFNFSSQIDLSSPFTFQNILSGIMDYIGPNNQTENTFDISCSNCGNTYSEFKRTGLLGCSECYKSFASTLKPIIRRVQGNWEHTGKLPRKAGESIIKRKKLIELKENLQNAITNEEYEKAAQIRDEIRSMQEKEK
ncbi:UvrB/UvrC motif-containing protein [Clostridium sp. CX1]|uniref:UvrB/UvrC motif-containing protein n=1 Tax=Clostridium sp. CX1 TaxID=2978346 RepID=UPI0021C0B0E0|nr:UvrB/UvrC motif-containing protein [Clostridium sp. CX1]MCT8976541.1 UvrB/UvrC motif-containing protein [Clostridium sp. CX1]